MASIQDLACDPSCPQSPVELIELSEASRSEAHCLDITDGAAARCDKVGMVAGMARHVSNSRWFTFVGAAGSHLPARPPGNKRCGTDWTGWLVSDHPVAGAPRANGTVCFSSPDNECATSTDVHVCACKYDAITPTYSYQLPATKFCFLGYCGSSVPLPLPPSRPGCKAWCAQLRLKWVVKCTWMRACAGCAACVSVGGSGSTSSRSGRVETTGTAGTAGVGGATDAAPPACSHRGDAVTRRGARRAPQEHARLSTELRDQMRMPPAALCRAPSDVVPPRMSYHRAPWMNPVRWAPLQSPRRVWDVFMFDAELDLLEARLRVLSEVTDFVILGESNVSHSGLPKPLSFTDHRQRFSEFAHKIHLVQIQQLPRALCRIV